MPRYRRTSHPETRTACEAFVQKKAEIDSLLARLQQHSADHFGVNPDAVQWGHVGDLEHVLSHLREITDSVFKEGEYAEQLCG